MHITDLCILQYQTKNRAMNSPLMNSISDSLHNMGQGYQYGIDGFGPEEKGLSGLFTVYYNAKQGLLTADRPQRKSPFASPNMIFGHPNALFGHPNAPFGKPNAPFGHPNAPFGHPNAPFGNPNAPFGNPNAPFGNPNASFGNPNVPFGKPKMTFGMPEIMNYFVKTYKNEFLFIHN
jgi:hypothetical protein